MLRHLLKDSQRSGACSLATRMPGARWRLQLARRTTALRRKRELFRRRSATLWCIDRTNPVRHAARAASSPVSPPPDRQPAQWRFFACHARAGCVLEVTAGTSHHYLALRIRGLSPVQGLYMIRETITVSVTRRARAASLRVTPPPKRQPAQWRLLFASNANAGCVLEATARTSHHGLAPKDRGLPPAKCHCMARRPNKTVRRAARLRKLACVATSRETASAVALDHVPREGRVRVGGHS